MSIRSWLGLGILLALLAACGYRPVGAREGLPTGVDRLHVALFSNRTYEPYLESLVTDRLLAEFARQGDFVMVESGATAEAELTGSVTRYRTRAIAFDSSDQPVAYRSTMAVEAALTRNSDGRVLWKGESEWTEEYPAAPDKAVQEENEAAAVLVLADRIAEDLYLRLSMDF